MADSHEVPGDEGMLDDLDPDDIDVASIEREERAAARRLSAIEAGRRRGGAAGAAMAGAMLALSEIYEGAKPDDDIVAVAEHPGEPGDIDRDGISMRIGDVDVWAPPPMPDGDEPQAPPSL
jgi:hypothetical protein